MYVEMMETHEGENSNPKEALELMEKKRRLRNQVKFLQERQKIKRKELKKVKRRGTIFTS
jgi:hypothetical protein